MTIDNLKPNKMDNRIEFDYTPIMAELFSIHAKVDALTDCLVDLNDRALFNKFSDSLETHFKNIVNEFDLRNPGMLNFNPYLDDK
jgi:hypothetical protein